MVCRRFTGSDIGKTKMNGQPEDTRQCRFKGMAVMGISKVFVFIGLILVDLAHIARAQGDILVRRYEILGDGAGNESGGRLLERMIINGENKQATAIARALLHQYPDPLAWPEANALRASPAADKRHANGIVRRRPQYIGKRDLRHVGSPPATGTDFAARRRRRRSVSGSATELWEKRAAPVPLGMKRDDSADSDIGVTDRQSSLLRKYADMAEGDAYKTLRDNVGHDPYPSYDEDTDTPLGKLIAKRWPLYMNRPSKKALKFIGKRLNMFADDANDDIDKRARSFIGKRTGDAEKRARSFIGKRVRVSAAGDADESEKRALKFIGKRVDAVEGNFDDFPDDTSRWNNIQTAAKRSRQFIGKRFKLPSAADFRNRRRAQLYIGKRAGTAYASLQRQSGEARRRKRSSERDGTSAAKEITAQRQGA